MTKNMMVPIIVIGGAATAIWLISRTGDDDDDAPPFTPLTKRGCTDIDANNYTTTANEDDGSCTYDVDGCTDSTANNYDPSATVDDGSCTHDAADPLDSFTKHTNKSLYPGFGSSDLNKPGRETIVGVGDCAQWCLSDATCVAFHHWRENPSNEVVDKCFYWSGNQNPDETHDSIEDALGPGDEGKGSGHVVDAYIRKAAESSFINGLMSFHAF